MCVCVGGGGALVSPGQACSFAAVAAGLVLFGWYWHLCQARCWIWCLCKCQAHNDPSESC